MKFENLGENVFRLETENIESGDLKIRFNELIIDTLKPIQILGKEGQTIFEGTVEVSDEIV